MVAKLRAEGRALVDLCESNPTRCGLSPDALVAELGDARGARYEPDALGHAEARRAVAHYYEDRGFVVPPSRVTLCASTSEAYGWIFKLLCEPGDAVAVPAPSYPLLGYLAALEGVRLVSYGLVREEGFRVDLAAVERLLSEGARAIELVHPNNPTGTLVRREEAEALERLAAEHGAALVVDEVFGDYVNTPLAHDRLPSFVSARGALTFVLSGLSKVCALPQVKLAWIATTGPDAEVAEAMARLEVIADTYLSVGTPVQRALPTILAARADTQVAVRGRVEGNRRALLSAIGPDSAARVLPCDGGWYAVVEVARTRDEDAWVELLLEKDSLVVHPGWFFDMDREAFLVVSLLPEPEVFARAASALAARTRNG